MGYDVLRFVNIGDILEDELVCSICVEIYEKPLLTLCDHMFCSNCIKRWLKEKSSCPICKTNLAYLDDSLRPAPIVIKNILGKLQLHCDFHDLGCEEIIRVDALVSHTSKCKFRPKASVSQMFNKAWKFLFDRKDSIGIQVRPPIRQQPNQAHGQLIFERFIQQFRNGRDGHRRHDRDVNEGNQYLAVTSFSIVFVLILFGLGTYILLSTLYWLLTSYPLRILAVTFLFGLWLQRNGHH